MVKITDPVVYRPGSPAVALVMGWGYMLVLNSEATVLTREQESTLTSSVWHLQAGCRTRCDGSSSCANKCGETGEVLRVIGERSEGLPDL